MTLKGVGEAFSLFCWRLLEAEPGVAGVEGEAAVGEEAAARCMNFMVRRREDIDFGCVARAGVLFGEDMVSGCELVQQ